MGFVAVEFSGYAAKIPLFSKGAFPTLCLNSIILKQASWVHGQRLPKLVNYFTNNGLRA
jgi:hypothetical protein